MAGNVCEWTAGWYDANAYSTAAAKDPHGPTTGSARVLRGGGWLNDAAYVRAAYRHWIGASARLIYAGFRCARAD
jgi:formylglycine-generating enzyme required for sulfatase activity